MKSFYTEEFDAATYLKELKHNALRIFRSSPEEFLDEEIWHFARPLNTRSFPIDWGVEMYRIASGRGYRRYLFVGVASSINSYVQCGAMRPIFRLGSIDITPCADEDHARIMQTLYEETDIQRRLFTEHIVSQRWRGQAGLELQKTYYNHWPAEYRRLKQEAKAAGWKMLYDMPI